MISILPARHNHKPFPRAHNIGGLQANWSYVFLQETPISEFNFGDYEQKMPGEEAFFFIQY